MATVHVSLPDPLKEFIEEQARKEGFGSVSEYLGSLIREVQKHQAKRELEAKLREGLESGPSSLMTREDWDAIEREGLHRAAARRQE
jgi:antitoxin ParD1/3/4